MEGKEATSEEVREEEKEGMEEVDLEGLERVLDYSFRERNLVEEAVTHPSSYPTCSNVGPTYHRLEFIGDSVLDFLMARQLFFTHPSEGPGRLSKLLSANVATEKLARIALENNLHKYLRHDSPHFRSQIEQYKEEVPRYPGQSTGLIYAPKILANIVESLIGAIFIDSNNLEIAWKAFGRLAKSFVDLESLPRHPVAELNELCQKNKIAWALKDTWEEDREVKILVDGKIVGSGTCETKKEIARNRAAKIASEYLETSLESSETSERKTNRR